MNDLPVLKSLPTRLIDKAQKPKRARMMEAYHNASARLLTSREAAQKKLVQLEWRLENRRRGHLQDSTWLSRISHYTARLAEQAYPR
jgi:hypothetical protein